MRRRPSYQYCCQEAPPVMNLPRTELAAQLRTQYKEPAATRRLAEACGRSSGIAHSLLPNPGAIPWSTRLLPAGGHAADVSAAAR